ncbi:Putative cytochrome b561/ferric reductase transmembrane [Septoria linicola]|uniref:Cytochrome b561/ferric reductase transmembrane n=1 Tax=Septoria linicola TaxID=215465 RepID=A0A9Q9EFU9_9PEZI|nr:Putative cytochrome b561/ferric reductase transmembrane [Septoria linicola]
MKSANNALLLLAQVTIALAWGGHYSNSDDDGGSSTSDDNDTSFRSSDSSFGFGRFSFSSQHKKLVAHAVLATFAFGFLFPAGGILIRLASFRGLWLVHGLCQLFAYAMYVAAFGLGVYLVRSSPRGTIHDPHPIIGIILLGLIFFQPFFGLMHHLLFKKYLRRTFWSYAHLWLGRIVITLGIINGGLGLRLARRFPLAPPSRGAMIGYGVAAGIMWLLYVLAALVGERRRSRVRESAAQVPERQKAYASSKSSSNDGREQHA